MESEVRQIQLKCLEILDVVVEICNRHNIQYSLCGGSVVGAHLYQGCLPWDDDVDLMMNRENYNKFVEIAPKELPSNYSIQNFQLGEDYTTPFTKIIDNNSTLVQQNGTISGLFLDITVYDRIPDNFLSKIDIFLWKVSQVVTIGKIDEKGLKARMRNLTLGLFFKNPRKYLMRFQKIVEKLGKTKKYHYSELFGAYANTVPFPPHIFENYTELEFEGKKYMVVGDYIEYLQRRYNRTDFREPKEKQIAPHYEFVDFNLPWREYLKKKTENGI